MSKKTYLKTVLAVAAAALASAYAQDGVIVYDNSLTPTDRYVAWPREFGDGITLAPMASYDLTSFAIEYKTENLTVAASKTLTLRIYANDGPEKFGALSPGTLLFESGATELALGYKSVSFGPAEGFSVPSAPQNLTWTVTFDGLGAGESAGLLTYDPPTIGGSGSGYWAKNDANEWSLYQIQAGEFAANFAARAVAVPEPGTVVLLLAGVAGLGLITYRRRS